MQNDKTVEECVEEIDSIDREIRQLTEYVAQSLAAVKQLKKQKRNVTKVMKEVVKAEEDRKKKEEEDAKLEKVRQRLRAEACTLGGNGLRAQGQITGQLGKDAMKAFRAGGGGANVRKRVLQAEEERAE